MRPVLSLAFASLLAASLASYTQSCRDCKLNKKELKCGCDGSPYNTVLDLDLCLRNYGGYILATDK